MTILGSKVGAVLFERIQNTILNEVVRENFEQEDIYDYY